MLATGDDVDGLPGHVSGLTQSALFVFMSGIQVALIVQEWFLLGPSSYVQNVQIERYTLTKCKVNHIDDPNTFLYRLSYPMLLLLLQICVIPFIIKSQRNYKEGLLFSLGSISVGIIWIGWLTMYIILGNTFGDDWYDKSICCGLLLCSTILIAIIYIPKV